MSEVRAVEIGGQRLIRGDNLQALPTLADCSVDLVLTDAPYALTSKHCRDGERANGGFMGAKWDGGLAKPETWVECFRVLKPGGSCLVMMTTRQDCLWRSYRDIEAAGFELNQTSMWWCYRTGFCKGGDLSKMADARAGAERKQTGVGVNGRAIVSIAGENTRPYQEALTRADGSIAYPRFDEPATDLAIALDGWYTKGKVKPAVEVIIWARKPISEKTELANMERHGVGGVNCGACMVPWPDGVPQVGTAAWGGPQKHEFTFNGEGETQERPLPHVAGRFPANLLVSGQALGEQDSRYFDLDAWAAAHGYSEDWAAAAEAGVLQVAKPSRAEKNAGCEGLETGNRPLGIAQWENQTNGSGEVMGPCAPQRNPHPTCKPVTLFAYLIEFLTRPGATVLDPFLGSGTTLVAAAQTGRAGIGIENSEEYFAISCARVTHQAAPLRAMVEAAG